MATYSLAPSFKGSSSCVGSSQENITALYKLQADSSGILTESSASAALAIGDKIRVAFLNEGFEVTDAAALVSTAAGQEVTASIGFEYVDSLDDSSYPQSATAFFSALALNSAARTRTTSTKVIKPLPKPAYLTVTIAGAALSSALVAQITLNGVQRS
jgi:hypothetical protein